MTPEEVGKELEKFDYDYFLNLALEEAPKDVDTREGSIMYDAVAPACYTLAEFVMMLKNVMLETFVQTATGGYLDMRAEEHGIKRLEATHSYASAEIKGENESKLQIATGQRFSTIGNNPIYFSVVDTLDDDKYLLKAETEGTVGNSYLGELLPIDHINDLESARLIEITIPARDKETDASLRERVLKTYQSNEFGGNVEDYIRYSMSIEGVGAVQIYPIWNGGGTVKVVILDNDYEIPSSLLIDTVQEAIDPKGDQKGLGIAPIGHNVTVVKPDKKEVNVGLHIDPLINFKIENLKPQIEEALERFFKRMRSQWDNHNENHQYAQTIYRSQIISTLLQLEGVANVSEVTLNGKDEDLAMVFTNMHHDCPYLGEVTYQ